MTPEFAINVGRDALWTLMLVSAPVLVVGFVVGILISLVQAVMQLHEITIAFVPKMIAIGVALVVFASWMLTKISIFTVSIFTGIPGVLNQ